jgi:hypothetical protein
MPTFAIGAEDRTREAVEDASELVRLFAADRLAVRELAQDVRAKRLQTLRDRFESVVAVLNLEYTALLDAVDEEDRL